MTIVTACPRRASASGNAAATSASPPVLANGCASGVIITMLSCGADGCAPAFFGFAARFGAAALGDTAGLFVLPRRADFVGDAAVVSGAGVDGFDAVLRRVDFFVSDI